LVDGNHVEHWLNGAKVVEYELGSEEWKGLVRRASSMRCRTTGKEAKGHIALQDHGDRVSYRDIKIRPIKGNPRRSERDP